MHFPIDPQWIGHHFSAAVLTNLHSLGIYLRKSSVRYPRLKNSRSRLLIVNLEKTVRLESAKMPEPLRLNKTLLNQLCKVYLKQVTDDIDEYYLYSLQLTEWILENGEAEGSWKHCQLNLLEQVRYMYGWENLRQAQNLLLNGTIKRPLVAEKNMALLLKDESPEWAGQELAINLYENLGWG